MSDEPQSPAISKRRLATTLLLGVLLAAAVGAKRVPLPPPNPERGSIGITVRSLAPIQIFRSSAKQVFFVRIEEGVDPFDADAFLPSNYVRGRQVFLLNVRPGRYLAVAAALRAPPGMRYDMKAFFSEKLIPLTEVTVVAGEVVFAGDFLVATHLDMRNADRAQTHYYGLISPKIAGGISMGPAAVYRAELDRADKDSSTEREFWNEVRGNVLTSQEWHAAIAKRPAVTAAPTVQRAPAQATPAPTPQASPEPTPEVTPEPMPQATPEPTPRSLAMGATDDKTPGVIALTDYSFQAPSNGIWRMERTDDPVEMVVLTKNVDEAGGGVAFVELKVIRNVITDRRLAKLSGKENANNLRNMERDIMIQQGVRPGLYQLHNVTMGEEMVAGRQFYFMDYRTETATDTQPSSLYLFFPKERDNQWFIEVYYTQVWPKERASIKYSKSDIMELLRSLELRTK